MKKLFTIGLLVWGFGCSAVPTEDVPYGAVSGNADAGAVGADADVDTDVDGDTDNAVDAGTVNPTADVDTDVDTDTDGDTDSDTDVDADTDTSPVCIPQVKQQCSGGNVHWFDSCGTRGAIVDDCAACETCTPVSATTAACVVTAQATQQCGVDGNVHWFDSCGVEGAVTEPCAACETCANAACSATVPQAKQQCGSGGDVHYFDSCGIEGAVAHDCAACETCGNTSGMTATCTATTAQAKQQCGTGGDVHYFDSCGVEGAVAHDCLACESCSNNSPTEASCAVTVPQAAQQCGTGNAVHWFNSCGVEGAMVKTCAACEVCGNTSATTAVCAVTTALAAQQCGSGGDVYWFNSCGTQGAQVDDCLACESCSNTSATTAACAPTILEAKQLCYGHYVYWYDTCNVRGSLIDNCVDPPEICIQTDSTHAECDDYCDRYACWLRPVDIVVTDAGLGFVDPSGREWDALEGAGKSWLQAIDYCETLNYGGHTDWRLPNYQELLEKIWAYGTQSTATHSVWTSSPDVRSDTAAWALNTSGYGIVSSGKQALYYVQCVRGPQWSDPPSVYTRFVGSNNTYRDRATGLTWRIGNPGGQDWEHISGQCTYDGFRLPTIHELRSLIDITEYAPASTYPALTSQGLAWSSTEQANDTTQAWAVDLSTGRITAAPKTSKLPDLLCVLDS